MCRPFCAQGVGWRTYWAQECAASEASARPLEEIARHGRCQTLRGPVLSLVGRTVTVHLPDPQAGADHLARLLGKAGILCPVQSVEGNDG